MLLDPSNLNHLGKLLAAERKRQKLTREQAASICQVSPSFIRDAETTPGRCSLAKLVQLCKGLGLSVAVLGYTPTADSVEDKTRTDDLVHLTKDVARQTEEWVTHMRRMRRPTAESLRQHWAGGVEPPQSPSEEGKKKP